MSKQNGNEDFLAELITKACGKAVYLHVCVADFPRALTGSSILKTITSFVFTYHTFNSLFSFRVSSSLGNLECLKIYCNLEKLGNLNVLESFKSKKSQGITK